VAAISVQRLSVLAEWMARIAESSTATVQLTDEGQLFNVSIFTFSSATASRSRHQLQQGQFRLQTHQLLLHYM
jgi:hypothetical protein